MSDISTLPLKPNITFIEGFLSSEEATQHYHNLLKEITFKPDHIRVNNQLIETKRKFSFHGSYPYSYSGQEHLPEAFSPTLSFIKDKVETICPNNFNAVLCNFYEQDEVMMGYHADKERELGENPIIASINFGQTRRFSFRYRRDIGAIPTTHRVCEFELSHGSLLIMGADCQKYFEHSLLKKDKNPKNKEVLKESWPNRINLTFRKVIDLTPALQPSTLRTPSPFKKAFTFKK